MSQDLIIADRIGKRFRPLDPNRPWTFADVLTRVEKKYPEKWALRNVSFRLKTGHAIGVLGHNGAGKTTLLRVLGGVMQPEEGSLLVGGEISGLVDLGAGFHSDLTGRENIYLTGVAGGLTKREVAHRFDSIVEFSELGEVIGSPLRIYSTGMVMRLAFAITIHLSTPILLVDEVLAVGDIAFQEKCLSRISDFKANGGGIVLVSHDVSLVSRFCDEAIWLRRGEVVQQGPAANVASNYRNGMRSETIARTPLAEISTITRSGHELILRHNRFGSLEVQIKDVRIDWVESKPGDYTLRIEVEYAAADRVEFPILNITITQPEGIICYETATDRMRTSLSSITGPGRIGLEVTGLRLEQGTYFVDVGFYEKEWFYAYDYHYRAHSFDVKTAGLVSPQGQEIHEEPVATWFR